jgi:Glycosyl hydrolase family 12
VELRHAAAIVLGLAVALTTTPAVAAPVPGIKAPATATSLCQPREWTRLPDGAILYNDEFGTSPQRQCVTITPGSGFRLTVSDTTTWTWQGYPDEFYGCEYTVCSADKVLPAPVSRLGRARLTLWTRLPQAGQAGNDATDFWFTRTDPGDSPSHPDGAELMLWLGVRDVGVAPGRDVTIRGAGAWHVGGWTDHADGTSWRYIQMFRLGRHREPSLTSFQLGRLLEWCVRHGLIGASWWASSFDAGSEVVWRGAGFRVIRYRLAAS